jgi:hypothetical protein
MAWRDLADELDRLVVETFDYGGVTLQKVDAAGQPAGDPIPLPAEFESGFVRVDTGDGTEAVSTGPALTFHYGHLADGVEVAERDRFIVSSGKAAGTYVVDLLEPNADRTGATARLKRLTK